MYFFKCYFTCICLFVSCSVITGTLNRTSAKTSKGEIRGWIVESKATPGRYMRVYKGIPYGQPPVNELRFKDPLPAERWTFKDLLMSDPAMCPQYSDEDQQTVVGNEDCLYLNVYTPEDVFSTALMPVMVWIHGGAYTFGSSDSSMYGPDFLVDQGIVFVSVNYRLGALGFLNLGTDAVPGNAALKDQLLALEWVQSEIRHFWGDPAKVTVFGESAGAASLSLLYLAPKSKNLFRNAIFESGDSLAEISYEKTGMLERAEAFSSNLNCALVNGTVQLPCLQQATVKDILFSQTSVILKSGTFKPSLEKVSRAALLSDTPSNLLDKLLTSPDPKRSIITGINKDEGIIELKNDPNFYTQFYSSLQNLIPTALKRNKTEAEIQKMVALIKTEYFNNTPPSLNNLDGVIRIYTDTLFAVTTAQFARRIGKEAKLYLYSFDFSGKFDFPPLIGIKKALNITDKVAHADELGYIFSMTQLNQTDKNTENLSSMKTLRRMVKMWTNFAKYENPTPDGTSDSDINNFKWTPITDGAYRYLRVTDQLNMSTDNFKEKALSFWSNISTS